jgi:hypothetical protein
MASTSELQRVDIVPPMNRSAPPTWSGSYVNEIALLKPAQS